MWYLPPTDGSTAGSFKVCSVPGNEDRGRLRGCGSGSASSRGSVPDPVRSRHEDKFQISAVVINVPEIKSMSIVIMHEMYL